MDRRLRTYRQTPGRCSGLLVLRIFYCCIFICVFKTNVIAYGRGIFLPAGEDSWKMESASLQIYIFHVRLQQDAAEKGYIVLWQKTNSEL